MTDWADEKANDVWGNLNRGGNITDAIAAALREARQEREDAIEDLQDKMHEHGRRAGLREAVEIVDSVGRWNPESRRKLEAAIEKEPIDG